MAAASQAASGEFDSRRLLHVEHDEFCRKTAKAVFLALTSISPFSKKFFDTFWESAAETSWRSLFYRRGAVAGGFSKFINGEKGSKSEIE